MKIARDKRAKVLAKRNKHLTGKSGKIDGICAVCKKAYKVFASQARHRGTSFCSRECQKISPRESLSSKPVSKIKKKLWEIFSRYIRLRDALRTTGGTTYVECITCGATKLVIEVDAGHFYSRSYSAITFDEKNVHAQCKKCNMPPNNGEQYTYAKAINDLYGPEELERLTKLKLSPSVPVNKEDLLEKYDYYKLEVKRILEKHGSPWQIVN